MEYEIVKKSKNAEKSHFVTRKCHFWTFL